MNARTARQLNQLTSRFYQQVEASFSATRQTPWRGWERVQELVCTAGANDAIALNSTTTASREAARHTNLDGDGHDDPTSLVYSHNDPTAPANDLRLLDLACGNLRFERFLAPACPNLRTWAIDNCDELALSHNLPGVVYQHLDVVQTLLDGTDLAQAIQAPACDLCVCFGFMHHLALPAHRLDVLRSLVAHTRPGGHVCVSFWQFERDPRILAKAQPLPDPGDYLLGWQGRKDAQRYCHSFSDAEVNKLVAALGPRVRMADLFHADGKTNKLNCYTLLHIS